MDKDMLDMGCLDWDLHMFLAGKPALLCSTDPAMDHLLDDCNQVGKSRMKDVNNFKIE